VRVKLDFEQKYATEADPWGIGEADAERYDLYYEELIKAAERRGTILDIGCGMGAFLARFQADFDRLVGVEVSQSGIERGRDRFPFIGFVQGSAYDLEDTLPADERYDAIVFSDVINYFTEDQKRRALAWIREHLTPDGIALIAAYSPGDDYLDYGEFKRLVEHHFAIQHERVMETQHVAFVCRAKRSMIAITVDYETWQPIPEGETIDWEEDVFAPTGRLLDAFDAEGIRLTLMVEMGEYLWLRENEPPLAERMEGQWRDAARRGHDVQLHLHPNWLPELGARRERDGSWSWDVAMARADDYPGDLRGLIGKCKQRIESVVREEVPEHSVTCFRAGAYEAQPFARLHDALVANGVVCDSSVLPGDRRSDRSYDYTLAYSTGQPYFASRHDPQLKAPPAERSIVELPVYVLGAGRRWTFEGTEGSRFAGQLLERRRDAERLPTTSSIRRRRRLRGRLALFYWRLRRWRPVVNRLLPRRLAHRMADYGPERLVGHDYFVMVAHSKSRLDTDAIRAGLRELRSGGFEFVTLSEMVAEAREELNRTVTESAAKEAERQVRREYQAVMGTERNLEQSEVLQRMIPLDRRHLLDVGCGAGTWSERIASLNPWINVVGTDVGTDFVEEARRRHASDRVSFEVEDFASLSFQEGSFDCVYADNVLEHAFDVDATLSELHRVLTPGGALVAAIPSDAYRPDRICDNHTWKTVPHDVRRRLEAVGFLGVEIEEIDTFKELGAAPFPPSADRMMYVRCWKPPWSEPGRAKSLNRWVYESLSPERMHRSSDPVEIIADGDAWCWGYVLVLGEALRREGYDVRWVTMVAEGHPRGHGRTRTDSHEVIEVAFADGSRRVLDPMAGVVFDDPAEKLIRHPERANTDRPRDPRYRERDYDLYATSRWYELVTKFAVNETPRKPRRWIRATSLRRRAVP
jgi:ubiquinone/menaquinone biosynthesis C-methylase UbiE